MAPRVPIFPSLPQSLISPLEQSELDSGSTLQRRISTSISVGNNGAFGQAGNNGAFSQAGQFGASASTPGFGTNNGVNTDNSFPGNSQSNPATSFSSAVSPGPGSNSASTSNGRPRPGQDDFASNSQAEAPQGPPKAQPPVQNLSFASSNSADPSSVTTHTKGNGAAAAAAQNDHVSLSPKVPAPEPEPAPAPTPAPAPAPSRAAAPAQQAASSDNNPIQNVVDGFKQGAQTGAAKGAAKGEAVAGTPGEVVGSLIGGFLGGVNGANQAIADAGNDHASASAGNGNNPPPASQPTNPPANNPPANNPPANNPPANNPPANNPPANNPPANNPPANNPPANNPPANNPPANNPPANNPPANNPSANNPPANNPPANQPVPAPAPAPTPSGNGNGNSANNGNGNNGNGNNGNGNGNSGNTNSGSNNGSNGNGNGSNDNGNGNGNGNGSNGNGNSASGAPGASPTAGASDPGPAGSKMNTGAAVPPPSASRTTFVTSGGSVLTIVTADPSVETGVGSSIPGSESGSGPGITGTRTKGGVLPTSTGGSTATPTDGSGRIIVEVDGHGLSDGAQKAIIAVSTIFGFIAIVGLILFFLRRRHRKRSEQYINGQDWLNDERRPPAGKPSMLNNLASKVPLLGRSRGWSNLGDHGADTFDEKRAMTSASAAHAGAGAIAIETSFSRTSHLDMSRVTDAPIPPIPTHIVHAAKPSILSPTTAQPNFNLTMQSAVATKDTASRNSDMSSLSSGFADSDIVVPPAVARKTNKAQRRSSQVSSISGEIEPNTKRYSTISGVSSLSDDMSLRPATMISEISAETAPRFRTVNSWVRHQNDRGSRPGTRGDGDAPPLPRPPPEQEYNLMMSDEQEPRRVEGQLPGIGKAM